MLFGTILVYIKPLACNSLCETLLLMFDACRSSNVPLYRSGLKDARDSQASDERRDERYAIYQKNVIMPCNK